MHKNFAIDFYRENFGKNGKFWHREISRFAFIKLVT